MFEDKPYRAKIIESVDTKKKATNNAPENNLDGKAELGATGQKAGSDDSETAETVKPEKAGAQIKLDNESAGGLMEGGIGKSLAPSVIGTTPYEMFKNGVFSGVYKSTVDQVATNIKGIVITTIFQAYLLIGYYLLAVYFDSDESKAFSKNPYKETSINDLAKRDDIPFTRQRLTDCIKAAAVDMELNKYAD